MVGFGEFQQEDARGEVVDVGEAEGDEGGGELVGDDFDIERGEALFHCGRDCAAETGSDVQKGCRECERGVCNVYISREDGLLKKATCKVKVVLNDVMRLCVSPSSCPPRGQSPTIFPLKMN